MKSARGEILVLEQARKAGEVYAPQFSKRIQQLGQRLAARSLKLGEPIERCKRLLQAEAQQVFDPRNPVRPLAMNEMTYNVERAPAIGTLTSMDQCIGKPPQHRIEYRGCALQNRETLGEAEFHRPSGEIAIQTPDCNVGVLNFVAHNRGLNASQPQEQLMRAPELYATAVLLALFTSPAAAQGAGTIEFGAFGQASYFDQSLRFEQAKGGPGVRLGIFALPSVEIEAEGAFVPLNGRPTGTANQLHIYYMPLRARLLLNLRSGEHGAFLLGGGFVRNEYRHDIRFHDNGVTGLVGARLGLPGRTNIRLATYADYIPSPSNGVGYQLNWGIQVGLGFLLGGGGNGGEAREATPVKGRPDSLALAAQRDSLARAAQQDSLRMRAARDSAAQAARAEQARAQDSVRQAQQKSPRHSRRYGIASATPLARTAFGPQRFATASG